MKLLRRTSDRKSLHRSYPCRKQEVTNPNSRLSKSVTRRLTLRLSIHSSTRLIPGNSPRGVMEENVVYTTREQLQVKVERIKYTIRFFVAILRNCLFYIYQTSTKKQKREFQKIEDPLLLRVEPRRTINYDLLTVSTSRQISFVFCTELHYCHP